MTHWARGTCGLDELELRYLRTGGAGRSIVLLHGLIGSGACWTPVARGLAPELDVVMPDARGHGDSSAPPAGYRYQDHAGDVLGLIDALGLVRPVLLGHSMGGMTAAVVAAAAPGRLRGLVLVDPTFLEPARQHEVHASDVAAQHRALAGRSVAELVAEARARSPHRSPELLALLAEARRRTSPHAFEVLTPPGPDHRALVRALAVPTLLVTGDRQPVVSRALASELGALNPRVRVEEIAGAGHGLPFDQPERLAERVAGFVRALT